MFAWFYDSWHPGTVRRIEDGFVEVLWETEYSVSRLPISNVVPVLAGPKKHLEGDIGKVAASNVLHEDEDATPSINGKGGGGSDESEGSTGEPWGSDEGTMEQVASPSESQGAKLTGGRMHPAGSLAYDPVLKEQISFRSEVDFPVLSHFVGPMAKKKTGMDHLKVTRSEDPRASEGLADLAPIHIFAKKHQLTAATVQLLEALPPDVQNVVMARFKPPAAELGRSSDEQLCRYLSGIDKRAAVAPPQPPQRPPKPVPVPCALVGGAVACGLAASGGSPSAADADRRRRVMAFVERWRLEPRSVVFLEGLPPQVSDAVLLGFCPKEETRSRDALMYGYARSIALNMGYKVDLVQQFTAVEEARAATSIIRTKAKGEPPALQHQEKTQKAPEQLHQRQQRAGKVTGSRPQTRGFQLLAEHSDGSEEDPAA